MRCATAPAALLAALAAAAGCGTVATTDVTGPSAARCQASVSLGSTTFAAAGGRADVEVRADRECGWTATSSAPWLTITPTSGQGEATITATAAANPQPTPRSAVLDVNGVRAELGQEAAPCRYDLERQRDIASYDGGSGTVAVTTTQGCSWTARSQAPWLTATGSGTGSGTVTWVASHNDATTERTGTIQIGTASVSITQRAAPAQAPEPPPPPDPAPPPPGPKPPSSSCTFAIDPTAAGFSARGGDGRVRVKTADGCRWTASSNDAWIVLETTGGVGDGDVRYRVEVNSSTVARVAVATIAGQSHVVRQDGAQAGEVEVKGTAGGVSGSCPSLSFAVKEQAVITTMATRWSGDGCRALRNGSKVAVRGLQVGGGPVTAVQVEVDAKEND